MAKRHLARAPHAFRSPSEAPQIGPRAVCIPKSSVLDFAQRLQFANTTNGLTAVKLHRIRQALSTEGAVILKAFEEIERRYAVVDDAGEPVVAKEDNGEPILRAATGTPEFLVDAARADARMAELVALGDETASIMVNLLTAHDLTSITVAGEDVGPALAAFAKDA